MNPRYFVVLAVGAAALSVVVTVPAQVVVRGTESSDNSTAHSQVNINTMDRTVIPLVKDTRQTKPDANTVVTETVTRERLNDGSYFDAQRSTAVKKTNLTGRHRSFDCRRRERSSRQRPYDRTHGPNRRQE